MYNVHMYVSLAMYFMCHMLYQCVPYTERTLPIVLSPVMVLCRVCVSYIAMSSVMFHNIVCTSRSFLWLLVLCPFENVSTWQISTHVLTEY